MRFQVNCVDRKTAARAGILNTGHGTIETPVFMPVGTQGTVKAVSQKILEQDIGAGIILGNTYHLYLRPGTDILREAGGLHEFMNWKNSILTDSGGFQIFSLSELRKIDSGGVEFKSHLDGSKHYFSPARVIEIQRIIGSDMMMVLDECTPYPCEYDYARKSKDLTTAWAYSNKEAFEKTKPLYGYEQSLFGIAQGSVYPDLREESVKELVDIDFDGYAIGGLAVGEPVEKMYEIVGSTAPMLPEDKPRYLMGVGRPENILEAVERGVDMFDCVMPTRNARNANLFTSAGTLSMRNAGHKNDFSIIDPNCRCYTCRNFSRAYLRHLFIAGEVLALELATIHNLTFYIDLMKEARNKIVEGSFFEWKSKIISKLSVNKNSN